MNARMNATFTKNEGKIRLWVVITCQWWFILGNKCIVLVRDIDNGEAIHVGGWAGSTWEISLPSSQFSCEPKATLTIYLKKFQHHEENPFLGFGGLEILNSPTLVWSLPLLC